MSLSNIRIVLVEPSHPGNIGAAARAMKTMGLESLYLVRPNGFPSKEADDRAVSAIDVLGRAVVTDDLQTAVSGCKLVVGGSGRVRELPLPCLDGRKAGVRIAREAAAGDPVAVLFGSEQHGLSNHSLSMFAPTNSESLQAPISDLSIWRQRFSSFVTKFSWPARKLSPLPNPIAHRIRAMTNLISSINILNGHSRNETTTGRSIRRESM